MTKDYDLVYIVILNYNGWSDTIECLESILKLGYPNYKIVIVDNGSSDGSVEKIKSWALGSIEPETSQQPLVNKHVIPFVPKPVIIKEVNEFDSLSQDFDVALIITSNNRGFSAGNNIGIRYAVQDPLCNYVWLLNNDTVIPAETLQSLVDFHQQESKKNKIGIVGHPLFHYKAPHLLQVFAGKFNPFSGKSSHIGEDGQVNFSKEKFDYPIGASMLVSVDYLMEVGLMDERYFLYFEEMDWVISGRKFGWRAAIAKNVFIYHKHGSTTGNHNSDRSEFSDNVVLESRILFYKKNYPWLIFVPIFMTPFIIFNRIKRKQSDRIPKLLKTLFRTLIK